MKVTRLKKRQSLRKYNSKYRYYYIMVPLGKQRIMVGDIFQSCSYHPTRCTEVSYWCDDIVGTSLLTGAPQSCSIRACGVFKMTDEEVQKSIDAYNSDGERGLMMLNGWPKEDADNFIKEWR